MTSTKFLQALCAFSFATAGTAAVANDATETRTPSGFTVAMGENLEQPNATARELRSHSHGRHAAPHTVRNAAPIIASERPPRPPIAVAKTAVRQEATASRVGATHIFPPRGFPKW